MSKKKYDKYNRKYLKKYAYIPQEKVIQQCRHLQEQLSHKIWREEICVYIEDIQYKTRLKRKYRYKHNTVSKS